MIGGIAVSINSLVGEADEGNCKADRDRYIDILKKYRRGKEVRGGKEQKKLPLKIQRE